MKRQKTGRVQSLFVIGVVCVALNAGVTTPASASNSIAPKQ